AEMWLYDFFPFKPDKDDHGHQQHQGQGEKITPMPLEFRHIFEVHAIYTGDKRQRKEEGRKDCKQFHHVVVFLGVDRMVRIEQVIGILQNFVVVQNHAKQMIFYILQGRFLLRFYFHLVDDILKKLKKLLRDSGLCFQKVKVLYRNLGIVFKKDRFLKISYFFIQFIERFLIGVYHFVDDMEQELLRMLKFFVA